MEKFFTEGIFYGLQVNELKWAHGGRVHILVFAMVIGNIYIYKKV